MKVSVTTVKYEILWFLFAISIDTASITCGILSIFIIKGNARFQLEVSENKFFFPKLGSQTLPSFLTVFCLVDHRLSICDLKKLFREVGKRCEQVVHKKDVKMVLQHIKRYSISFKIRQMQVSSPWNAISHLSGKNSKAWQCFLLADTLIRHSYLLLWEYKIVQPLWRGICQYLTKLHHPLMQKSHL